MTVVPTPAPSPPTTREQTSQRHLSDQSRGSSRIILERRWDLLLGLVVPGEAVDPGLDQDKTELGVLVFPVGLQVLADGDRLFDEVPEVLWDGWSQSVGFEDTENLVTGDETDLGNAVRVTEDNTNLGGGETLTGELDDVLNNIIGSGLQPSRRSAAVGESRGRNALSGSVHTTHDE
jgi:hypothetical protein